MATESKERRRALKQVPVKGPKGQPGKCVLYSDGTIRVDWVRFSYPHVDKPWGNDEGDTKAYSLTGLLPKKNKKAKALIDSRIEEILKENKVRAIASDRKFLRDGDESGKEEEEGCWKISARETKRPPLRGRDGTTRIEPEEAGEFFVGGYWGSMLIRPWWQNHKKHGKRVNAGLSSAQFFMEDETFGEGRLSDDDLDDTYENMEDLDDSVEDYDDDEDEEEERRPRRSSKKRRSSREVEDDDDDDDDDLDI